MNEHRTGIKGTRTFIRLEHQVLQRLDYCSLNTSYNKEVAALKTAIPKVITEYRSMSSFHLLNVYFIGIFATEAMLVPYNRIAIRSLNVIWNKKKLGGF